MIRKNSTLIVFAVLTAIAITPVSAQVTFTNVTSAAKFLMAVDSRWSTSQTWGDYDNDGDIDVYVTSWGQASTGAASNALFRNKGDGTFENAATPYDIGLMDNSVGAAWGDFDNDGDLDLFVANFSEGDVVFKNMLIETGAATFTDVTSTMGFVNESIGRSKAAVWGDYNNDGYLDIYVAKYWGKNALYRNNSGSSFTLLTNGVYADVRDSEGAAWVDYDDDGDVDLYVINREQENRLYRNEGGEFTVVDLGINDTQFGRYGVWADFDSNGKLDLFLANIGANTLYQQSAAGSFSEISGSAGVQSAPGAWDTWGATFGDYNGDGRFDLFFVGGFDETSPSANFSGTYGNILLENLNNSNFFDRTGTAGLSRGAFYGAQEIASFASSAAFVDFDNDGDPDISVTNTFQNILYRNDNTENSYIKVGIEDTRSGFNRNGLGAKVRIYDSAMPTVLLAMHEIRSGVDPMIAHFGGLTSGNTYKLEITFLKSGSDPVTVRDIFNITVPADTIIVVQ